MSAIDGHDLRLGGIHLHELGSNQTISPIVESDDEMHICIWEALGRLFGAGVISPAQLVGRLIEACGHGQLVMVCGRASMPLLDSFSRRSMIRMTVDKANVAGVRLRSCPSIAGGRRRLDVGRPVRRYRAELAVGSVDDYAVLLPGSSWKSKA